MSAAAASGGSASLDPIETILPALGGAGSAGGSRREDSPRPLPPSASGEWSPGWSSTRADLPRRWAPGWDTGAKCPPAREAAPGGVWREVGTVGGSVWREHHEKRRQVVSLLRRAGYVARHRWGRTDTAPAGAERPRWTYNDGPAAGCRAVDPWELAAAVSWCSAAWYAQGRITGPGELRAIGLPRACGRAHLCTVCAARESAGMARALRSLVSAGRGALVTLTHRDAPGRSLAAELDRLRSAMQRLWSGRARASWCERVSAWWYGIETTYNEAGGWWHVHAHVIVQLADGSAEGEEAAASWLGERWGEVTATAAAEVGLGGARHGWDAHAGRVTWPHTRLADRAEVPGAYVTPAGGWWRPVDLGNPAEVYQACKYPTPAAELPPVQLAEFVAAAHGRRWHDGGGEWRGVRARAEELAAEGGEGAYDIGRNISRCGPRDVPALDAVAPGLGIEAEPTPVELVPGMATFVLARGAPVEAVAAAAALVGGHTYLAGLPGAEVVRLVLPASYVGALVHEWAAASAAAKAALSLGVGAHEAEQRRAVE